MPIQAIAIAISALLIFCASDDSHEEKKPEPEKKEELKKESEKKPELKTAKKGAAKNERRKKSV